MNLLKTSLLALIIMSTPLMSMAQRAPQRVNPCTQLKAAFILAFALLTGKTIRDYRNAAPERTDPSTLPIMAGRNIKTTIIDSISGLPIESVTDAIASFKEKNGPAECDLVPYALNGNLQTLKLTCRELTMEESIEAFTRL